MANKIFVRKDNGCGLATRLRVHRSWSAYSVLFAVASVALTACGTTQLTADSKCSDYLKSDGQTRYDAAIRISSELQMQDAGNPMWEMNFDAACGPRLNMTIRQVFGK